VQIEDRGIPMPKGKLHSMAASEQLNPKEPREGGFGLQLIRSTMDRVVYRRKENGVNVVRLYKRLDRAA
jgi:anti-sigma regulatory factor (Ser/Thr protein kinase)